MCDGKCFFNSIDIVENETSEFLKNVIAIQNTIIKDLQNAIDIVKHKVFNVYAFNVGFKTVMKAKMRIKRNYIDYIIKYGLPADGIFDPVLLAEFPID